MLKSLIINQPSNTEKIRAMFLHTLSSFFFPLTLLFAGGLSVILWLLPRKYLSYGFFLAPVAGLTVFSSLGLFEIGILLVPLRPLTISFFTGLVFVATAWLKQTDFFAVISGIKTHGVFIVIPLALLFVIAAGTREHGLSFLSAGQDEIQYINNSLQILQHQHTGDELDTLVPRTDHWARDAITIVLSYGQTYRRGAEIFLAGVMDLTGENPFVSFTIACVIAFFCFILVLPAICQAFLGMPFFYSLLTQAILAATHLWIMLLLQGSLANLCSLSLFCLAATAVPRLHADKQLGAGILAGLLLAGPIIFYNEVAMAVLLTPMSLIFFIDCIKNRTHLKNHIKQASIAIASLTLFSHIALFGLAIMTFSLLSKTITTESTAISLFTLSSTAGVLAPIYGLYTYYALSFINNWIAQLASSTPWLVIAPIALLQSVAIWGLFRKKIPGGYVLATALIVLIIVTINALITSQPFMLVRSQQYAFSYTLIGFVLAISMIKRRWLQYPLITIMLFLAGLNLSSIWSTTQHLYKYDDRSDPIIIRYSPHSELWSQFLKHVNRQDNDNTPILITDYDSTAKPYLIASLIEPHPNFMGAAIRKIWNIMSPPKNIDETKNPGYFGVNGSIFKRMSFEAMLPSINDGISDMNEKSQLGIIMVGSDDPDEWGEKRLISRQRKRFSPIADIIERDQWSPVQLEVDEQSVPTEYSEIKHINKELTIQMMQEPIETACEFELIFDTDIKQEDVATDVNFNDKIHTAFKGNTLTLKASDKNRLSFHISVSRKKGLNLKQLRMVEVY